MHAPLCLFPAEDPSRDPRLLGADSRGRGRRERTSFSKQQVEVLISFYETNRYPGFELREHISALIKVSEARVQVWFQSRRARDPPQKKDGAFPHAARDKNPQGVRFQAQPRAERALARRRATRSKTPLRPQEQQPQATLRDPEASWDTASFSQCNRSSACPAKSSQPGVSEGPGILPGRNKRASSRTQATGRIRLRAAWKPVRRGRLEIPLREAGSPCPAAKAGPPTVQAGECKAPPAGFRGHFWCSSTGQS
ncbi:homeobox protein OTX-like [Eublepharis macularius]|uniref:Homeobox protein OTX-like n=1 Tax=Eublepharis macularius TaxID=481883 RepID=A0AA97JM42_EUBMA|nr:homeobox protein OTX-like [Eublepharis macularius]